MKWDYADRRKRERFYRRIFRAAVFMLVLGALVTAVGIRSAIFSEKFDVLVVGFLIADLSVLAGYLAVTRTVRIIDLDHAESRHFTAG